MLTSTDRQLCFRFWNSGQVLRSSTETAFNLLELVLPSAVPNLLHEAGPVDLLRHWPLRSRTRPPPEGLKSITPRLRLPALVRREIALSSVRQTCGLRQISFQIVVDGPLHVNANFTRKLFFEPKLLVEDASPMEFLLIAENLREFCNIYLRNLLNSITKINLRVKFSHRGVFAGESFLYLLDRAGLGLASRRTEPSAE